MTATTPRRAALPGPSTRRPRRTPGVASLLAVLLAVLLTALLGGLLGASPTLAAQPADRSTVRSADGSGSAARTTAAACGQSARGVPTCGAYFGGATGANADPSQLENQMGGVLGVRRTFYSAGQTSNAVETARRDLARGRLPWISLKVPHSWSDMADGRGDAWARSLVDRLDDLDGPVWLALHHEPENEKDASVAQWRRMQERLGPIVRQRSDNVAFTVIVMGYHQLYGEDRFSFERMWPRTTVDVAGFDVYNFQGMPQGDGIRTEPFDIKEKYFEPLRDWARSTGTRWALAETGYTDYTAAREPEWIRRSFNQLKATGGIAMSYFNSRLNSDAGWTLSNDTKRRDYKAALGQSLRLPR